MTAETTAAFGGLPAGSRTPVPGPAPHGRQQPTGSPPVRPGAFLDAVQAATPAAAGEPGLPTQTVDLVPHPFYEGEMYDPEAGKAFWGKDGPGFADFLDIINPLQHLPVVSSIYRELTGDELSPASRLAGGALFGGPIGLAGAFVTGIIEEASGRSVGGTLLAMLGDDSAGDTVEEVAAIAPEEPGPEPLASRPLATRNLAAPAPDDLTRAQVAVAGWPGGAIEPVNLLPARKPTPLAVARSLLEASSGDIPTPPPAATRRIIAAEERQRQAEEIPDPVSAILGARSQVPRGGAVPGLGTRRLTPELNAITTEALPPAAPKTVATDKPEQAYVPGKRGAPPPRQSASAIASARRHAAQPVPNTMVSTSMMSALDKYEAMIQQRNAEADGKDLTM